MVHTTFRRVHSDPAKDTRHFLVRVSDQVRDKTPVRDTVHIDNQPPGTPRQFGLAQNLGSGPKSAQFAKFLTSNMNNKYACIPVEDFMKSFVPGDDMTKDQFKHVGSLFELGKLNPAGKESEMYPILVRTSRHFPTFRA